MDEMMRYIFNTFDRQDGMLRRILRTCKSNSATIGIITIDVAALLYLWYRNRKSINELKSEIEELKNTNKGE